ncbi:cyclic nucleotide-binding domain-containing protein [Peribacillus glennii]|uniref:cyclic nucleotide-binding domain-containing protein n=1 Tax=Peribacillus glennii TaxID=2303991 RepID=UPI001F2E7819|nr:cyclic nucleotide-binding domain-containing protein [Peribacillus glennii]
MLQFKRISAYLLKGSFKNATYFNPVTFKGNGESIQHTRKMEKGRFLFQKSTNASEPGLILSGKVRISKLGPDGRELTLRICSNDGIVGEMILSSPRLKIYE